MGVFPAAVGRLAIIVAMMDDGVLDVKLGVRDKCENAGSDEA